MGTPCRNGGLELGISPNNKWVSKRIWKTQGFPFRKWLEPHLRGRICTGSAGAWEVINGTPKARGGWGATAGWTGNWENSTVCFGWKPTWKPTNPMTIERGFSSKKERKPGGKMWRKTFFGKYDSSIFAHAEGNCMKVLQMAGAKMIIRDESEE